MKINNKFIGLYSIFFILFFIILFSLDFIYKKYAVNLKVGYHYTISGHQFYSLKEDAYDKLLEDILIVDKEKNLLDKDKIFRVQKFQIIKSSYTLENPKSLIKFNLILPEKANPNELEKKMNEKYSKSISKVISDLQENLSLFDYRTLEKEYSEYKLNQINKAYDDLVNSEFFKKFTPTKCNAYSKKRCLEMYIGYYNYFLEQLELNPNKDLVKLFSSSDNSDYNLFDVTKEFYSNSFLFDKKDLFNSPNEDLKSESRNKFFTERYNKLINSKFFMSYVQDPENYCRAYRIGCFLNLSDNFNTMLYKHRSEQENKFKVKIIEETKKDTKVFDEIPKILGLTIFFTYIFFLLTNKFFKRKLK